MDLRTSGTPLTADDLLALREAGVPLSPEARVFLGLSPDDLAAPPRAASVGGEFNADSADAADVASIYEKGTPASCNGSATARRPPLRREVLYTTLIPFARRGAPAKLASELLAQPYTTVLAIYNDPAFRREVTGPMSSAFGIADNAYIAEKISLAQQIERAGQLAFDTLCEILRDTETPAAVRVTAARDLLDRNASTRAGTNSTTNINLTSIDAAKLVAAAAAARALDAHPTPTVVPIDHKRSA